MKGNAKKINVIFSKSNIVILCSFLLPVLLLHYAFYKMGFYPFGEKTVLIMDLKGEYLEYFASLRYIFKDNSVFYSWSRSMGGEMLGLIGFYIASPLSFITLLFPVSELPAAMYWLTILKTGLCGLTLAIFLEFGFDKRKGNIAVVAFATFYALMSYNIAYGMCLMWLDGVIFLPLVLLGVEKIFEGRKGLLYMLSITGLFICNYYTAYMAGIFTAMYFVVKLISVIKFNKEEIKQSLLNALRLIGRFAFNTILAAGISMPLILPVVKDLLSGKLQHDNYCPTDIVHNFEFFDVFKKLLPGQYDSITNTGALPSIYCGVIVAVLALLFIFARNINLREKVGHYVIAVILLISFWSFKIDVMWHGFQHPNWFPYRYAFLFSAVLVIMASRLVLSYTIKWNKTLNYAAGAFLIVYACIETPQNAVKVCEGLDNQFSYGTMEEYTAFLEKTAPLVEETQNTDDGFYRMEKDYEYSKNDAMLLGYNGMTHYSSTFNEKVNTFTKNLGFAQTYQWNSGYGSTLLTDSLFNIKYKMLEKTPPSLLELKKQGNGANLYENTDVLSIGYMADSGIINKEFEPGTSYFENQEKFIDDLSGYYTNCFNRLNVDKQVVNNGFYLDFTAQSQNPVYLNMKGSGWAGVYVDGSFVGNYFSSETTCNLYLGEFSIGEQVSVYVETSVQSYDEMVYELNTGNMKEAVSALAEGNLNVTEHKMGSIKGTVKAKENRALFTSIPYSKGFRIKVDGVSVLPEKYADTFIVIPLEEGEHEIEFSYISPGFLEGVCVAMLSVIILLLYYQNEFWKTVIFKNIKKRG